MDRPLSPLRHDYKPSAGIKAKKRSALPWFAAGLGIPLVGIALVLSQPDAAVDHALPTPDQRLVATQPEAGSEPAEHEIELAEVPATAIDAEPDIGILHKICRRRNPIPTFIRRSSYHLNSSGCN